MDTTAVILSGPENIALGQLGLIEPSDADIVVEITHSGISTGTEKLFWQGNMPPFPGMGYPLVPGYEAAGEVVEAGRSTNLVPGDRVFVPGANCYEGARGLFGAATARLVTPASRAVRIDKGLGAEGALLALAATARHAMAGLGKAMPELIVGHGVLGRLLARITIAAGAPPPVVWEIDENRQTGAKGYQVLHPDDDTRRDYRTIYDASGAPDVLNMLMGRICKGGEIVLAGFYADDVSFAFPPAFMKEARFRIAAEWTADDLVATRELVEAGMLSLDGLITHTRPAAEAALAYPTAFRDLDCLKMILEWEGQT